MIVKKSIPKIGGEGFQNKFMALDIITITNQDAIEIFSFNIIFDKISHDLVTMVPEGHLKHLAGQCGDNLKPLTSLTAINNLSQTNTAF